MKTNQKSTNLFRSLLFTAVLLVLLAIPVTAQAATQKMYTIANSNTRVYSNTGLTKGYGWIYGSDEITVHSISSGYCKVTYPTTLWFTKTGYVPTKALFTATSGYSYNARAAVKTYRRPGGASYGSIYKGDKVLVLGTSGSYTQVRYPVSGGYKFAFITTSDCNAYIKPAPAPTPTPAPDNGANIANGTYLIRTAMNNKCLDVHGLNTANGTNIEICSYNGGNNQKFNVTYVSNGWYKLIDVNSGKAVDVAGGVKKSNVNVQLYQWNGSDAQLWRFASAGNGYFYIQNRLGYYLDVYNNQTADGTNVIVYSLNRGRNQQWKLEKTSASIGSTLAISGNTAPGTLTQGSGFTVKGIVSSNYRISKITVGIYTTGGSAVSTKTVYPNTFSYDINKIDSSVHFGYCKAGSSYVYKVVASDAKVSDRLLQSTTFSCIAKNNVVVSSDIRYPMNNAYVCGNNWRTYYSKRPSRPYHLGIDIHSSSRDRKVYAAMAGTVVKAGWNASNGNYVVIQHSLGGKTVYSFYAHLSSITKWSGAVTTSTQIGVVGNTGSGSAGEHLHFAFVSAKWSGSYYGYGTYFTGDKTTYGGVTYYNPHYVISNRRLP